MYSIDILETYRRNDWSVFVFLDYWSIVLIKLSFILPLEEARSCPVSLLSFPCSVILPLLYRRRTERVRWRLVSEGEIKFAIWNLRPPARRRREVRQRSALEICRGLRATRSPLSFTFGQWTQLPLSKPRIKNATKTKKKKRRNLAEKK